MIMNMKQKNIKIEPRIKLNYNIYNKITYIFFLFWFLDGRTFYNTKLTGEYTRWKASYRACPNLLKTS